MKGPSNRVRQARRHAGLSQTALATRVGVGRSAVAQWETEDGTHPTVENLARTAIATDVAFEWLATGRGRMVFKSDLLGHEEHVAVLKFSAQCEVEARALAGLRKLDYGAMIAIVSLIEDLSTNKAKRRRAAPAPYSR